MKTEFGPLYCETFLHEVGSFPVEPINTLSSFVPFVLGVIVLFWLYKKRLGNPMLYTIACGVALTGLGSVLWHGLRTPLSLSLDVFPGLVTFLLIVWYWPYLLGGRWWSYGTIISLFGGVFSFTWLLPALGSQNGPPFSLFFIVGLVGFALSYATYRKVGTGLALLSLGFLGTAIMAAIVRTVDLSTCSSISFGTHFMWHIFLGVTGSLTVVFMALVIKKKKEIS